ncbi:mitochondrial ribosomal protein L44 [Geopyxis carbonaria]|nr:mitochondrial ribosomal protein L44 [Geopyxis carbonaria]
MITRHLVSAKISFNPFLRSGRTARIFASLLPPDARNTIKITTTVLPPTARESWVEVEFKDGMKMKLDTAKMGVKDCVEQLDRHSRMLGRKDELTG